MKLFKGCLPQNLFSALWRTFTKTDSENSVTLLGIKKENKLNFEKHFKALAMSESWPTIKFPVTQT